MPSKRESFSCIMTNDFLNRSRPQSWPCWTSFRHRNSLPSAPCAQTQPATSGPSRGCADRLDCLWTVRSAHVKDTAGIDAVGYSIYGTPRGAGGVPTNGTACTVENLREDCALHCSNMLYCFIRVDGPVRLLSSEDSGSWIAPWASGRASFRPQVMHASLLDASILQALHHEAYGIYE